ncbi:hypothetical protein llap_658 [Limosa lapponica baueri]|uniref:Uncharacterized protein n=1 Tax=Limosa lapponica baueri TaxID=1758121 RepID=A0A2I0USH3_LIMLA|nr:hypothetical protein llap_658 [Limosa lapponica baueri]
MRVLCNVTIDVTKQRAKTVNIRHGVKEESVVGTSELSGNQETIFMAMLVSLEMKNEEESDEGNLSD